MEIDRTRDKALLETNTSDFKRFWSLLPNTGNGSRARILTSQADNSPSRAWLWPFFVFLPPISYPCSPTSPTLSSLNNHSRYFSSALPPIPPSFQPSPVRSAHEYCCTSWGVSGTAWYPEHWSAAVAIPAQLSIAG